MSELQARAEGDSCRSFEGHPDGVWVLTTRGIYEGMTRTMLTFIDATTGEQLCGEEISSNATPYPVTVPPGAPTPAPTRTPIRYSGAFLPSAAQLLVFLTLLKTRNLLVAWLLLVIFLIVSVAINFPFAVAVLAAGGLLLLMLTLMRMAQKSFTPTLTLR